MDVVLVVLAAICIIVGFAGCILPVLPGVPLAYVGLLLLHASSYADFSLTFLLLWGGAVVVVQLLDYFIPAWGAKKFGGTKYGIWGSTIGVLVGIFFGPWGIVLGPFIGAVIGELLAGKQSNEAFRAGVGAFVGFIAGTLLKLVISAFFMYYYIKELV